MGCFAIAVVKVSYAVVATEYANFYSPRGFTPSLFFFSLLSSSSFSSFTSFIFVRYLFGGFGARCAFLGGQRGWDSSCGGSWGRDSLLLPPRILTSLSNLDHLLTFLVFSALRISCDDFRVSGRDVHPMSRGRPMRLFVQWMVVGVSWVVAVGRSTWPGGCSGNGELRV